MTAKILHLKRVRAGEYETLDGRFSIVAEPEISVNHGGPVYKMGSRSAWWIYETETGNGDAINVNDPCRTLFEARRYLAEEYEAEAKRG